MICTKRGSGLVNVIYLVLLLSKQLYEWTVELRTSLQLLCIYNRFRELFSIKFSNDLRPGTVGRRAIQLMCGVLRVRPCHHRGGSGECQGSATVPQTGQWHAARGVGQPCRQAVEVFLEAWQAEPRHGPFRGGVGDWVDQGRLVPEEVRECCSKLLITLVIQTGLVGYGSCVEKQLLEFNEHQ